MSHIFKKQNPSLNFTCYMHDHRFQKKYTLHFSVANTELYGLYMHLANYQEAEQKIVLKGQGKQNEPGPIIYLLM